MSRYSFKTTIDDKQYEVAYGFDRQLSEYFIQVFDYSKEEDMECIVWEGSYMTNKSNGEMLKLYKKWNVPEEHIEMVALDLTF